MLDFNFITPEYKLKLFLRKFVVLSVALLVIIIGVELGISYLLSVKVKSQVSIKNEMTKEINDYGKQMEELAQKRSEIPDLTNDIDVVEDLISQNTMKFSEVLLLIQQETPPKIWYTNINNNKNRIILEGYSAYDYTGDEVITPNLNVFNLERRLKDTGKFKEVKVEYLKDSSVKGNPTKSFKYTLILN
ncbi:MAG: PilN domain-containing protein [Fusobacteriota bacterium]